MCSKKPVSLTQCAWWGKRCQPHWTQPWPTHKFASPAVHHLDLGSPELWEGSQPISCLPIHAEPYRHTKPYFIHPPHSCPAAPCLSVCFSPNNSFVSVVYKQHLGAEGAELKDTNWWNIMIFCLLQQLTLFCNLSQLSGGELLSLPFSRQGMSCQVTQLLEQDHVYSFSQKKRLTLDLRPPRLPSKPVHTQSLQGQD